MFFGKNKPKVLSLLKGAEFEKYSLKIEELFSRNNMQISIEEIESYDDWFFVDDGENVVAAVSIHQIDESSDSNVYVLSNFISLNYKESKISLEEHRKAISDIFEKAVKFAKMNKEIDYLVQGVDHFDVRASVRAGFNADLLRDRKMSAVVKVLVNEIQYFDKYSGIFEYFENLENYKQECLRAIYIANSNLSSTLNKKYKSKTTFRMLRALRKNREFIDKNPAGMAYRGLILGVKTS